VIKTNEGSWGTGGNKGNRRTVFLVAGLTALAVLATLAFAALVTAGNPTPNDRPLLPIGSEAPEFASETVDGGSFSLGDAGGDEATMLVFFATWCPHCQHEAPIISELESRYEDLQVVMVGIDRRDDPGKVRGFVKNYGIEGPALYEPSLASTYRVSGYPTIYVLDGNGEVKAAHSGEAPREIYEGWIGEALGDSA
jgi:thiol-disulfide isomerase/thioredoxin